MISYLLQSLFAGSIMVMNPALAPGAAPIHLVTEPLGAEAEDGIEIRVVGIADSEVDALYTLEVESDVGAPDSSRSVQRGRAQLRAGQEATLATVRLPHAVPGRWEARLLVEPARGASYSERRNAY